jgi:hypothetical protein
MSHSDILECLRLLFDENPIMTMSSLCIFLKSREQKRLPAHHPFYHLVRDALLDVIRCPLILHYMAKGTFANESHPDEDAEKQRVQEIIQYLQNNSPQSPEVTLPRWIHH